MNSSSENERETIGVVTSAYCCRACSPSARAYTGERHHFRHCSITPFGRSPTLRSRFPGKYPKIRNATGATTYQSHQARRLNGRAFSRQYPLPAATVIAFVTLERLGTKGRICAPRL